MLELRSVSKAYGGGATRIQALSELDLTIEDGEFVTVMGPSGSGKSTLLNLVAALDVPSSGTIALDGADISSFGDDALTLLRRSKVGLIFQAFNLLPTLDVLDNVLLPVMIDRRVRAADTARAAELLHLVGLGARRHHRPPQLSGGEQQRVAVARAMMMRPRLLLADEPTGNLDSTSGQAILRLLRESCDRTGTTVVMVTHDHAAAEIGDRILTVKDGKLIGDEPSLGGTKRVAE